MKIQEDSKEIIEGAGPKISYMEANTKKGEETCIYAPDCTHIHPEHVPCAPRMAMRLKHDLPPRVDFLHSDAPQDKYKRCTKEGGTFCKVN